MEAILFALSMEVALLQMRILESSTMIRSMQWNGWKPNDNWKKLEEERVLVKTVLKRTLVELADTGVWSTLQQTVEELKVHFTKIFDQKKEHEDLRKSRLTMMKELRLKRLRWSEQLRNANARIASLRDKKKDDLLNASLRLCYAEKWLVARAESLEHKFQAPRTTLPKIENENRVHQELINAFEIQIKEREEKIEYWRKKYADDIAVINQLIAEKQEKWQVECARRKGLQKTFDEHHEEIKSWLNIKRERADRVAEEERRKQAAMRAQAWWRGTMVRRGLGVFKFLKNVKKPSAKGKKK